MSADAQFRAFIDRILRCREAEDAAKDDTKAVYAELAGEGYEKAVAGQVVNFLRKREKNGDKLAEQSALFDRYLDAYERASHTHTRARGFVATLTDEQKAAALAYRGDDTHGVEPTQEQPVYPATRRLDGFGSVQDGLKMSNNGLSAGVAEQQNDTVHVSVTDETAGETAPSLVSHSAGEGAPRPGAECGAEPRQTPVPHSPASPSQALQADKTSEAVAPPAVSLVPNSNPLNPDCRRAAKGEQCALMHSQASCSACANAAMKARAA